MSIECLMDETVELLTRDPGEALSGEPLKTFSSAGTTMCHIQQGLKPSRLQEPGEEHDPKYTGWFPIEAPLVVGMRLQRSGRFGNKLLRFATVTDAAGQGHHLEAVLCEVC